VRADVDRDVPAFATKHIVPQTFVLRMALRRASRLLDVSSVRSAYLPAVSSLIRRDGIVRARVDQLVGADSRRAPAAAGWCRARSPARHRLGELRAGEADRPWPKMAIVSRPETFRRRSAP